MNEHDPFSDQDYPDVRGRLRALGSAPLHSGVANRVLERVRSAGRPRMRGARLKFLSAAAIAGLAASGVGLAAADVLPAPVQDAAHSALSTVGVNVPPGHNRYNDPKACPGGPYLNHGAYVRAHSTDPNAGKSKCGKPVKSVDPSGKTKGAGHGPPPWAHGKGKPDKDKPDNDDGESTAPSPTTAPKSAPTKPSATTTSTAAVPTTTAPTTSTSTTTVPTTSTSTTTQS